MSKLLCLVGPTATGKTGLALELTKHLPATLISADSRQVYRGMDIVTGKDHPDEVEIYGVDIVEPDQDCSVSEWQNSTNIWIEYAYHHNLLPIVVGGTGLYVRSIIDPIPTMGIPVDQNLRRDLHKLSVIELQTKLRRLSPPKLTSMNQSDINNPRRLIRAIEVATFNKSQFKPSYFDRPQRYFELIIGLKYKDPSKQMEAIRERVLSRLKKGAVNETQFLLQKYSPRLPSMSALGYKHLIRFIAHELSEQELIEAWARDELAYAKRQLTWFNKVKQVHWFDPTDPNLVKDIESLAVNWYHNPQEV